MAVTLCGALFARAEWPSGGSSAHRTTGLGELFGRLALALEFPAAFAGLDRAERPDWDKPTLVHLFGGASAATAPELTVEQKDAVLAELAGQAYTVPRLASESNEAYARRVLRRRAPFGPNVRAGQWVLAVVRQLYADLGDRAQELARFEVDRNTRRFLETKAREAHAAAKMIAADLEVSVPGLEGFFEPLPVADGVAPTLTGVMVVVRRGVVTIDGLDRLRFEQEQAPPRAERTSSGALREIYSAFKQFNMAAEMLGRYEPSRARNVGHLRAVLPAEVPARYLNELVRAGVEAKMHTLHLMVMSKAGALNELDVALIDRARPGRKKRARALKKSLHCDDTELMSSCAERMARALASREPFVLRVDAFASSSSSSSE